MRETSNLRIRRSRPLLAALCSRGLNTGIGLDCSHGNSGKDPACQADCVESALLQRPVAGEWRGLFDSM